MEAIVDVSQLQKRYGANIAVDNISFKVYSGEIFGIVGTNGAGKSTTVECMQSLRRPDSGKIRVLGLDPQKDAPQLRRRIGSQLQASALPDRIKVWEALDLFSAFTPNGNRNIWKKLLKEWGLEGKEHAAFSSLSGGQRQRLFIALALVNDPEVVFLDEMTSGLDPGARRVAWDLVKAIRDRGTTVVFITHFMDEAEYLCDRIAVMDKGRILEVDTPRKLISKHSDLINILFTNDMDATDLTWLETVKHVQNVSFVNSQVVVQGRGPALLHVAAALVEKGIVPRDLRLEHSSLEDVFMKITANNAPNGGKQ